MNSPDGKRQKKVLAEEPPPYVIVTDDGYNKSNEEKNNDSLKRQPDEPQVPDSCFGCRHIFALMGFSGLAMVYMMRVNLSVAIVAMVRTPLPSNTTTTTRLSPWATSTLSSSVDNSTNTDLCPDENHSNSNKNDGEFDWDSTTQGLILGCFFWGYMVTQIPGGILAERFGGKWVFGIGTLLTALFTLLTPVAARSSTTALIVVRVLTGLAEGVTYPSVNNLLSKWVPTLERTTFGAFVLAGTQFGTVISLPLSGVLCNIELDNGWPWAFYVPGALGLLWFLGWVFLVYETPDVHPRIDDDEKQYILATTGRKAQTIKLSSTPWFSLLTSIHLWAIIVAHVGHNWGFYMLLTELPTYMKTVLHFDLKANGLLSAVPYLAMWVLSIVFSLTADALRSRKILTTTQTRKVFNTIGFMTPACALIGASFTGCDKWATVALITVATGFNGAIYSGFIVTHVDIASNYAGLLMGMSNCAGNICGFLAPYIVNVIVTTTGSLYQWQLVFFISAGVYTVANLFYLFFGTSVEQPWNKQPAI